MKDNSSFSKALKSLAVEVAIATGKGSSGDGVSAEPRFPGFKLSHDIRSKIQKSQDLLREGKKDDAIALMEDAFNHLRGKQAAFVRGSVATGKHFWVILTRQMAVEDDIDQDLLDIVRKKIEALEAFVKGHFDLDEAAKLYRAVYVAIDQAYDEQNGRDRKSKREAAKLLEDAKERARIEDQLARDKAAQQSRRRVQQDKKRQEEAERERIREGIALADSVNEEFAELLRD